MPSFSYLIVLSDNPFLRVRQVGGPGRRFPVPQDHFTFKDLERMFMLPERMFQPLERIFQPLERKMYKGVGKYSLRASGNLY